MGNNIKISYCNCTEKIKEKYKKNFKSADLVSIDLNTLANDVKEEIKEDNKLFNEYVLFKYLYQNGGLVLNGDFEFINSINSFFENDFFIGFCDNKNLDKNIV